jgi:hypothetical protein
MMTATHCKEVSLKVINDIGALSKITKIVAEKGVNILAAATWIEDSEKGIVHLVTDDNLRTVDTLKAHAYAPQEIAAIAVEIDHKPGMLHSLADKIAKDDIDIRYLYVSAPINEEKCLVILSTDNNDRALVSLNK